MFVDSLTSRNKSVCSRLVNVALPRHAADVIGVMVLSRHCFDDRKCDDVMAQGQDCRLLDAVILSF